MCSSKSLKGTAVRPRWGVRKNWEGRGRGTARVAEPDPRPRDLSGRCGVGGCHFFRGNNDSPTPNKERRGSEPLWRAAPLRRCLRTPGYLPFCSQCFLLHLGQYSAMKNIATSGLFFFFQKGRNDAQKRAFFFFFFTSYVAGFPPLDDFPRFDGICWNFCFVPSYLLWTGHLNPWERKLEMKCSYGHSSYSNVIGSPPKSRQYGKESEIYQRHFWQQKQKKFLL